MKTIRSIPGPLLALLLSSACAAPEPPQRECVLDHVTHVENRIHLEVPPVPRLCDELGLAARRVSVGDCELFVEEEGQGVPLVLINGGPGGTHHYFHPWFSHAAGFARVLYYDQRGCGLSDYHPGERGYSVDQAVADLDALREALGIERWVVLGYSYGGFLAQYYATRHPRRVAGLVLLGASPGMRMDAGPSRQQEHVTEEERDRMREIGDELRRLREAENWSPERYMRLLVYNMHLNGDWKRQHFYRPSRERVARQALYEWVHDPGFNGVMGESQRRISLAGVFEGCPIPILILEGRWDLTWGEGKRRALLENHPGAEMVVFERAAHGIYDEEPERFFAVLECFVRSLPEVPEAEAVAWAEGLRDWHREIDEAPRDVLGGYGWGRASNERLAAAFDEELLARLDRATDLLKLGFALHDAARYEEALEVFERLESTAAEGDDVTRALGWIWQGHVLDLLGRREEAISRYERAAALDLRFSQQHGQYGMRYELSPWAASRIETPFTRVENRSE